MSIHVHAIASELRRVKLSMMLDAPADEAAWLLWNARLAGAKAHLPPRVAAFLDRLHAESPRGAEAMLKKISVGCLVAVGAGAGFAPAPASPVEAFSWFKVCTLRDGWARLSIFGEVGVGAGFDDAVLALRNTGCGKVEMVIDSSGGDSDCAVKLYDHLLQFETRAIIRRAYSSAVIIACAARRVSIVHDGKMMLHSPRIFALANRAELRMHGRAIGPIEKRWSEIIAQRTGCPATKAARWLKAAHYLTAEQSLAAGFVDEILPAPPVEKVDVTELPAGTPAPAANEDDGALMALLEALPHFRVSDRQKFLNEAGAAMFHKIN